MQQNAHDHFQKIYLEHEKATLQLEAQKKQLEEHEKQLQHREAKNETERKKLHYDKMMVIYLCSSQVLNSCLLQYSA